jgi:exopolysaccharide biosynthesis polyprenyl glycosylphosphotransferase
LGGSADLVALVQAHRIDEIVIAITHEVSGDLFQALMDCQGMGVRLVRMPDLYEQLTRRVPVEHIDQEWVLDALSRFSTLSHMERISRRLLDLACGLIGLAFLGLFLPLVALAIYLDDRGMVFYAQVRSGAAGKPFSVIKFRTMHCDAESDGQPQWAQEDDERATRVGRVLRKTRLDELPQVINVLRGEMSVVGPRPERPEFIAELEKQVPHYRARLVVKPGLTGWAQIHYGYGNSVKDALTKLQYDLYYIRRQSLWLDLYIVFRTIGVIFKFQGT